jgi:hypothetical protein
VHRIVRRIEIEHELGRRRRVRGQERGDEERLIAALSFPRLPRMLAGARLLAALSQ